LIAEGAVRESVHFSTAAVDRLTYSVQLSASASAPSASRHDGDLLVTLPSALAAQWANSDHLDLFSTDAHGRVWSTWWELGPGWQSWFVIHPESTLFPGATVTASSANSNHLDRFITAADGCAT